MFFVLTRLSLKIKKKTKVHRRRCKSGALWCLDEKSKRLDEKQKMVLLNSCFLNRKLGYFDNVTTEHNSCIRLLYFAPGNF